MKGGSSNQSSMSFTSRLYRYLHPPHSSGLAMYRVCPDQLHPSHLNLLKEKKRKEKKNKTFKRGQCPFPPKSQYAPEMQEMQITRKAPMNDEQRKQKNACALAMQNGDINRIVDAECESKQKRCGRRGRRLLGVCCRIRQLG